VLSDALLFGALILFALKFGLRARLRELGRFADGLVNVLLVLILGAYVIQLVVWYFTRRGH
jgi:hypothetical protein